ncbi:hypothetical protein EYF80_028395 [Liparis tanakae]|uniref:Uncharacterized protein n=1 Tax=Liparis tanakae TaxID=230148 RepID=A0A4Z2H660_9TELE|nr:hypothetical protein EYF80_028395 [Liparis tanakae]
MEDLQQERPITAAQSRHKDRPPVLRSLDSQDQTPEEHKPAVVFFDLRNADRQEVLCSSDTETERSFSAGSILSELFPPLITTSTNHVVRNGRV